MLLSELSDSVLSHILAALTPAALAAAQLTCTAWSTLITHAALWKRHAQQLQLGPAGTAEADAWRAACLSSAAAAKWTQGRLVVSSTLEGHRGPVTCLAVLQHTLITGSQDGTARVWDLARGVQQHALHMPRAQAVEAVALPSVTTALTATACAPGGVAVLWRAGQAVRSFEATPSKGLAALALTDTQVLLGSSGGSLQHFDLYNGAQQLMTRHSSGVSCLLPIRRQPQQEQHQAGASSSAAAALPVTSHESDWGIIVGCHEGQVSCISSSTGAVLWALPNRFPARVIALHYVEHQRLLFVLNARSQCIAWKLPAPELQGPGQRLQSLFPQSVCNLASAQRPAADADSPAAEGPAAAAAAAEQPAAPAAVGGPAGAAPAPAVAAAAAAAPAPAAVADPADVLAAAAAAPQAMLSLLRGWRAFTPAGSRSMAVPWLGSCLVVGSSLGYLQVLQLVPAPSSPVKKKKGAISLEALAASIEAGRVNANAAAGAQADKEEEEEEGPRQLSKEEKRRQAMAKAFIGPRVPRSPVLQLVREHSLLKLGQLLEGRRAGGAAGSSSSSKSGSQPPTASAGRVGEQQPVPEASKVLQMAFTASGQLVVGLASGHVAVLKARHAPRSHWGAN